ncbi:MAG: Threonine synthase [Firmicutes bacterium ADurb.Bin248]|nr:MAG: Threonine synthase [Firmicutes bacterium ADurb.Bin248]
MEVYRNTRNDAAGIPASRAILEGMADDGGLYVMPSVPRLDMRRVCALPAREISLETLLALLPDFTREDMRGVVSRAYDGRFETGDITPLVKVGDRYVLELFRGPTSAFKDVALCALPQLLVEAKRMNAETGLTMILTATSGDTGKAALAGFRDIPGTKIAVFYPEGGVSAVQRAQMVTQEGENVAVCAVRGNFDDAQTAVKRAFQRALEQKGALPEGVKLSSANSINVGRLAPQVMYYIKAYGDLVRRGDISFGDEVDFAVPTGNFGDILAGYLAMRMGLPVGRLVCASNRNDVLTDFIQTGVYDRRREFHKTASPSMDILVSSNLERLLYYECGCSPAYVRRLMRRLAYDGRYEIGTDMLFRIRDTFSACAFDDGATFSTIRDVFEKHGYVLDTHTAVAWAASEAKREGRPMVVLSTASPYKFAGDVLRAITGESVADGFAAMEKLRALSGTPVPKGLGDLRDAKELHKDVIEADEVFAYVAERARA